MPIMLDYSRLRVRRRWKVLPLWVSPLALLAVAWAVYYYLIEPRMPVVYQRPVPAVRMVFAPDHGPRELRPWPDEPMWVGSWSATRPAVVGIAVGELRRYMDPPKPLGEFTVGQHLPAPWDKWRVIEINPLGSQWTLPDVPPVPAIPPVQPPRPRPYCMLLNERTGWQSGVILTEIKPATAR